RLMLLAVSDASALREHKRQSLDRERRNEPVLAVCGASKPAAIREKGLHGGPEIPCLAWWDTVDVVDDDYHTHSGRVGMDSVDQVREDASEFSNRVLWRLDALALNGSLHPVEEEVQNAEVGIVIFAEQKPLWLRTPRLYVYETKQTEEKQGKRE